ncbi:hypothetical protein Tco_0601968 [Tanacetum coccineum]
MASVFGFLGAWFARPDLGRHRENRILLGSSGTGLPVKSTCSGVRPISGGIQTVLSFFLRKSRPYYARTRILEFSIGLVIVAIAKKKLVVVLVGIVETVPAYRTGEGDL